LLSSDTGILLLNAVELWGLESSQYIFFWSGEKSLFISIVKSITANNINNAYKTCGVNMTPVTGDASDMS